MKMHYKGRLVIGWLHCGKRQDLSVKCLPLPAASDYLSLHFCYRYNCMFANSSEFCLLHLHARQTVSSRNHGIGKSTPFKHFVISDRSTDHPFRLLPTGSLCIGIFLILMLFLFAGASMIASPRSLISMVRTRTRLDQLLCSASD